MNAKASIPLMLAVVSAVSLSVSVAGAQSGPPPSPLPTGTAPPAPGLPAPGLPVPSFPQIPPPSDPPEPSPPSGQAQPCVQRVAIVNNAPFALTFQAVSQSMKVGPATEAFGINQWRSTDLGAMDVPEHTNVRPIARSDVGKVRSGTYVSYCKNGQTATFSATGNAWEFTVSQIG